MNDLPWNNPHLERLLLRYGSGPARGEYDDLLKEREALRAARRLTEEERAYVETVRQLDPTESTVAKFTYMLVAIIDRLTKGDT